MDKTKKQQSPESLPVAFVTEFRHWRSGKMIRAADYGHKAFPIRRRKK